MQLHVADHAKNHQIVQMLNKLQKRISLVVKQQVNHAVSPKVKKEVSTSTNPIIMDKRVHVQKRSLKNAVKANHRNQIIQKTKKIL